jgi:glycosyltransferase involved in cell wall biosynthesis
MKDKKVSIITVSYNSEETIEKTIKSVLNQIYENIEYIIIDGNSNDQTLNIIKTYEDKFNGSLKWVSEDDNGIYHAMNKGIDMASGDFIGIINSDDWYQEDAVENIINTYKQNKESEIIYGDGYDIYEYDDLKYYLLSKQPRDLSCLLDGITLHHPSVFIKKNIYKKYGKYNLKYDLAADYELLLRMYLNDVKFKHTNEVIGNFRLGGASNNSFRLVKEYNMIKKQYNINKVSDYFSYLKTVKNILPNVILKEIYILKWKIKKQKYYVYNKNL